MKFKDLLEDVMEELNENVTSFIATNCSKYSTQFQSYYQVGMPVAVNDDTDRRWVRGLILKIEEKEDILEFVVFLSDIGQISKVTSGDLFPIPKRLVERLPFQAMAFALAHIVPMEGTHQWSEEVVDKLMDLTIREEQGVNLSAVVFGAEKKRGMEIPCRYYKSIMLGTDNDELGQTLVNEKLAVFKDDGEKVLKTVKSNLLAAYNAAFNLLSGPKDNEDGEGPCGEFGVDNEDEDQYDVVGFWDEVFEDLDYNARREG